MEMFKDYLEMNGKMLVSSPFGFATFYQVNDGLYIEDIYIKPEHRLKGIGSELADSVCAIAKERGLNKIYGTIRPTYRYSTESMKSLLAYGFKIKGSAYDAIALEKEI